MSNSLKYAFTGKEPGNVTVILKEEHDSLYLAVNDNGKGISFKEKEILGNSFGYRLIKVFKDQLQATLAIKNSNGTQVVMSIRKYRKVS